MCCLQSFGAHCMMAAAWVHATLPSCDLPAWPAIQSIRVAGAEGEHLVLLLAQGLQNMGIGLQLLQQPGHGGGRRVCARK